MKFDFPEHWQLLPLESVMEAIIDYRGKTPKKTDFGIPLVTAKIIKDGRILEPVEFIAEEEYDSWMVRGLPEVGDVVITSEAPLGEVAQLTDSNIALAQRVVTLRGKKGILNNDFLLCAMQSRYVQYQLESRASGSTAKGIKQSELRKVLLPIPPEKEQIQIAHYIKTLSNKIDLNRQINQTLEQIAQAIFKSWFIDFEPTRAKVIVKQKGGGEETQALAAQAILCGAITLAELDTLFIKQSLFQSTLNHRIYAKLKVQDTDKQGNNWLPEQLITTAKLFPNALVSSELGEIPQGWIVGKLRDILEFNPKRILKKGELAPYLDMKNLPTQGHLAENVYMREMASGTKFINGDTLLARITPCLENGKTAYVDFLEEGEVAWGSTEFIVLRPKDGRPLSLAYIIARLESFRSKAIQTMMGTSGRQRADAKALAEQIWINYPSELLDTFDSIAGSYLAKAKNNGEQIRTLSNLRDTLLPKLLSGNIETDNQC